MEAIDIQLSSVKSKGTAYYRLNKEFKDFLELCEKKDGIIGFEWDKKNPWNFGIILKEKKNDTKKNEIEDAQKEI